MSVYTEAINHNKAYPCLSLLIAVGLILLAPFISIYLNYIAFIICIYRVIRFDAKVFATDYAVLIPMLPIFRMARGTTFLVWVCLFAGVWYLVRGKIRADASFAILLILMNYLLLRMQTNINDYVLSFGQIFFLYVLLQKQDAHSAERTTKAFCISLAATSMYALAFRNTAQLIALKGKDTAAIFGGTFLRFQGLFGDPNYFMSLVIVSLAALCVLGYNKKISEWAFWLLFVVLSAFGLMTTSKAFLIVYVLLVGVYIVLLLSKRRFFKGVAITMIILIAITIMLIDEQSALSVLLSRFLSSRGIDGLTTGRWGTYIKYFKVITDNVVTFLFGAGMNTVVFDIDPHNIFIEMLYYVGVVGTLLILTLYCTITHSLRKMMKEQKISWLPSYLAIGILTIVYCSLQGMYLPVTYAAFFIATLAILVNGDNKILTENPVRQ